jgi:hypothetical protein
MRLKQNGQVNSKAMKVTRSEPSIARRFGSNELIVRRSDQGHVRYLGALFLKPLALEVLLEERQMIWTWKHIVSGEPNRPKGPIEPTMLG